MSDTVLELRDIRKSFFGIEVLHGINLSFKPGHVYGLVGENGAGKSTLMNIIHGVFPPDSGSMFRDGKPYVPQTPRDARENGIAFIHQELNLFSNLTVAENLYIDELPKTRLGAVDYKKMRTSAQSRLNGLGVSVNPQALVSSLPMGIRQTVEIVKALMQNAEILLFDEPTTSLSHKEKHQLFQVINDLKKDGKSIIYISHILEDVFELCDVISVLRDGAIIGTADTAQLDRDTVISMMVGRKLENVYPTVEKEIGAPLLTVQNLSAPPLVKDVSLTLHSGEILGVFGLMGAGRTEFVRALFGLDPATDGVITFKGEQTGTPSPQAFIRNGMAFITEDRRGEGLLMPNSVEENLMLVKLSEIAGKMGVIDRKQYSVLPDTVIKDLSIKVSNKKLQRASNLSGGNQQKVVIGKWLLKSPQMLIMDEPTRGVDVGSKYEIYSLIQTLAKQGSGILFISSEMEELIGICDRIVVFCNGRVSGELSKEEFAPKAIMHYALLGEKAE